MSTMRFGLGRTVITANALAVLPDHEVGNALARHVSGDWGDVGEEDRLANEEALRDGTRLMSVYRSATGIRFWIITEADRASSTVLLPEDY